MSWISPIYDRTLSDVEQAKSNRNDSQSWKGALNYVDWERITGNIKFVSDELKSRGINPPAMTSKLFWTIGEIPPRAEIAKIRSDLISLYDFWYKLSSTPHPPDLPYTHYQKINDIEKILFDFKQFIDWLDDTNIYSGQFYSGDTMDIVGKHFITRYTIGQFRQFTMKQLSNKTMSQLMYGW